MDSQDRTISKREAYSRLQSFYSSMSRSERLATSMVLIVTALEEVDQTEDISQAELFLKGDKESFNKKIENIQLLSKQLPAKTLVELGVDILCQELRAS